MTSKQTSSAVPPTTTDLAYEVLELSSRNIRLATEMLVNPGRAAAELLRQQLENVANIQSHMERIRKQLDSKSERELLDAASARWTSTARYEQALRRLLSSENCEPGAAFSDVLFPILLDDNAWRIFAEFLRAQHQGNCAKPSHTDELVGRTRALVRATQALKSTVAERKRMDEKLSQMESIIQSNTDAIIIATLDGTIVGWNAGAENVYGYSANETLGTPISILSPLDRTTEVFDVLDRVKNGENIKASETVHLRKDRQLIDVSIACSAVKDAEGKIVGAAAITRDISERKKAEERFYKAFHANPEPITITTFADGRYIDVNESFLRVTGCTRDEVIGHTPSELTFWDRPEDRSKLVNALNEKGSVRDLEITFVTRTGQHRTGLNSAEIIEIGGEKCVIAIFRDMTEQRALETQLRKSQRLEAIGQLSGGIAHDFNNLMTVVIGHSQVLEDRLCATDSYKNVEEIKKAGHHAADLTKQLLAFSRQQRLESQVLSLNFVVTDLEKMLRRLIGEHIVLVADLNPAVHNIKADKGQIQQVIMNLVVNARDAMPDGGRVTIKTDNVYVDEAYARAHPPQVPGNFVLLEISDTGMGMDPETQSQIFEPFFTTKELGKGTGLGLSTVYGVIKQSGGYIWVESAPGRGSTFTIYLPLTADVASPRKTAAIPQESLQGNETILLVEDAEQVRTLTADFLKASGYTVLEARSPDEAIQIAEHSRSRVHLLLTDMIMPGMGGAALAKKLFSILPGMKVLYMSGYVGFLSRKFADADAKVLSKPFTREVLLRNVRDALSSSAVTTHA